MDLEANHSLNPRLSSHIWLLHHLFLRSINEDAQEWAEIWNHHTLQLRHERNATPHDLYFFSMVQDGLRGVTGFSASRDEEHLAAEDVAGYGIDWDVADNARFMRHLLDNNPEAGVVPNPFQIGPATLSDVPCNPPNCPFTAAEVHSLNVHLAGTGHIGSRSMHIRCLLWQTALTYCSNLYVPN